MTSDEQHQHQKQQTSEPSLLREALKKLVYVLFVTIPVLGFMALRFVGFVLFASPGFLRLYFWYRRSSKVQIKYKEGSTFWLDIYGVEAESETDAETINGEESSDDSSDLDLEEGCGKDNKICDKPVVICVAGGAWMFGEKMWGGLIARTLNAAGVLVFVPQYRNWPTANVPGMCDDIQAAIDWTINNCQKYGGDPNQVVLVGQSAGGHLVLSSLLRQAVRHLASGYRDMKTGFHPDQIKGVVTVGAPCSIASMQKNYARFGVPFSTVKSSLFDHQMESYDPMQVIQQPGVAAQLPPIHICHGTNDVVMPYQKSEELCKALQEAGCSSSTFTAYEGFAHSDAMLERIMTGDNRFHLDVYSCLQQWTKPASYLRVGEAPKLCPHWMVSVARFFKPF